ncbi:hypothetical protein VNO78_31547 [Psophocarpus tetragonolobus]|uniref:Uncharacterized protein n=1 Tax=Psophocarpus tetragonolobus TaxID=3891 RepID=A0AAN9RZC5_PSOTE
MTFALKASLRLSIYTDRAVCVDDSGQFYSVSKGAIVGFYGFILHVHVAMRQVRRRASALLDLINTLTHSLPQIHIHCFHDDDSLLVSKARKMCFSFHLSF